MEILGMLLNYNDVHTYVKVARGFQPCWYHMFKLRSNSFSINPTLYCFTRLQKKKSSLNILNEILYEITPKKTYITN